MIIRNQSATPRGKKANIRLVATYGGSFLLIISFLAITYQVGGTAPQPGTVAATQQPSAAIVSGEADKVSVDQLTAAAAATDLAEAANLPVAGALRESTTSLHIKKELAQADTEVISKPQLVQVEAASARGITDYTSKEGDTIARIAAQFGVSAETVRWANNTTSDAIEPGKVVRVPRINGVVYTVKDGDTIQSLAEKYKADAERIVLYNDLDAAATLRKDAVLVLPGGILPENERPGYVAPRSTGRYGRSSGGGGTTTSRGFSYARASVGNRYARGNCTWYAYERRLALGRPIGSFWGNANTWDNSARAAGYRVDGTPAPGAIIQNDWGGGGYGHVGIVERVEGGIIYISDMNYAGYNVVTQRQIPLSQAGRYKFIH